MSIDGTSWIHLHAVPTRNDLTGCIVVWSLHTPVDFVCSLCVGTALTLSTDEMNPICHSNQMCFLRDTRRQSFVLHFFRYFPFLFFFFFYAEKWLFVFHHQKLVCGNKKENETKAYVRCEWSETDDEWQDSND